MGCIACAALVLEGSGRDADAERVEHGPGGGREYLSGSFRRPRAHRRSRRFPFRAGAAPCRSASIFDVDGAGADNVTVSGDLSNVERIGEGMTMGRLTVTRDVGARLGARMSGGEIVVGARRRRPSGRRDVGRPHRGPGQHRARGRRADARRPHRGARRRRRSARRRHGCRHDRRRRPARRTSGSRHDTRHRSSRWARRPS